MFKFKENDLVRIPNIYAEYGGKKLTVVESFINVQGQPCYRLDDCCTYHESSLVLAEPFKYLDLVKITRKPTKSEWGFDMWTDAMDNYIGKYYEIHTVFTMASYLYDIKYWVANNLLELYKGTPLIDSLDLESKPIEENIEISFPCK